MPPITRRTQVMAQDASESIGRDDEAQRNADLPRRKRTLSSVQVGDSTTPDSTPLAPPGHGPPPAKKVRQNGKPRPRPIHERLRRDRENEDPLTGIEIDKGKGKAKRTGSTLQTSSFLPTPHADSSLVKRVPNPLDGESDEFISTDSEGYVETEIEWFDEPHIVDVGKQNPSKRSEAVAIERPRWVDPLPSLKVVSVAPPAGTTESASDWPTATDLIYLPGTTKVLLTLQLPLICTVLQDAFENLRASLIFEHAFPDLNTTVLFVRKNLVGAARGHLPRAGDIHKRLLCDDAYLEKLCRLPRARIPLFRAEVKERCVGVVQSFATITPASAIAETVEMQLSDYRYTFPTMNNDGVQLPPMRTRPYRNARIITVIRDLYFTGGMQSFAHRFVKQFPRYQDNNGFDVCEVPIAMVALVATALYAAIYEWRSGSHRSMEFSSNAFLDVYQGHVDTLNHIRDKRTSAFHVMMRDIFVRVQSTAEVNFVGAPIAQINLAEMED